MNRSFLALVLAAGKSTRFKSEGTKLLHPFLGTTLLDQVLDSLFQLKPESVCLVVGHRRQEIMGRRFRRPVEFVIQSRQRGTAHAVMSAADVLGRRKGQDVLVINGDLPLVRPETLRPFLNHHRKRANALTFLVADLDNPTGFGRLVHGKGGLIRIVEENEATPSQRKIRECNLGVYLFRSSDLLEALPMISADNRKKEYYLTDIIEIMMRSGRRVELFKTPNSDEFIGVNDRAELALAADVLRLRKNRALAESGVTVLDPSSTWIDLNVRIGRDTVIHPSVVIEGGTVIGEKCRIHPFVRIQRSRLGSGVEVRSGSLVEDSRIKDGERIGPLAVRGYGSSG